MRRVAIWSSSLASAGIASAQGAKRSLSLDDLGKLKEVRDPQCSPDGKSRRLRRVADRREGRQGRQRRTSGRSASTDRTSDRSRRAPTASRRRASAPTGSTCRSPRRAPARRRATRCGCSIGAAAKRFSSPRSRDGCRATSGRPTRSASRSSSAIPIRTRPETPDPARRRRSRSSSIATSSSRTCRAICSPGRHTYIYLFDIATKSLDRLTKAKADESSPSWSPDGTRIAFMSNRHDGSRSRAVEPAVRRRGEEGVGGEGADAADEPRRPRQGGVEPRRQVDRAARRRRQESTAPTAWSISRWWRPTARGAPLRVKATEDLDRGVVAAALQRRRQVHHRARDRRQSVYRRARHARRPIASSGDHRQADRRSNASQRGQLHGGRSRATTSKPTEVYRVDRGGSADAAATHQNDALFAELQFGKTEEVTAKSKDGTEVHGLLTTPAGLRRGHEDPDAAADPRRTQRSGSAQLRASSVSGSRPTATPCSRSTIAAAPGAARSTRNRSRPTGATTRWTTCRRWSIRS